MRHRTAPLVLSVLAVIAATTLQPATVRAGSQVRLVPEDPTTIENCIPFGNNRDYGFTGFIYRNVPAFELQRGDRIAFDLGATNDVVTRREIYLSTANKNPDEAVLHGNIVVSQGVTATEWVKVSSEHHAPQPGRGNTVIGDYDLRYRVESDFSFPGGGLIIGFDRSPPAEYRDDGCEQVLVATVSHDSSDYFYARFCFKEHLDMGVLDQAGKCGATAVALGGVVIGGDPAA
jgi:hypothetical protein